jgi:hypothetical protein
MALRTARRVLAARTGAAAGAPALVAATVLAVAGCGQMHAAGGTPVPESAVARLTAIAHRAATISGDPRPVWITAVETTHAKALTSATPGDYDQGSGRITVFLITMRGHFTAREASMPPGAKAPTGQYLSLVIGAKTFRGLDSGIGHKPPPVSPASLGPVTYLASHRS